MRGRGCRPSATRCVCPPSPNSTHVQPLSARLCSRSCSAFLHHFLHLHHHLNRKQVRKARVRPGEERELKAWMKTVDGRRAAAEQASIVRAGIAGGDGSLVDALRSVTSQLQAVQMAEEAASASGGGGAEEEEEEEEGEEEGAAAGGHADELSPSELLAAALKQLSDARQRLLAAEQRLGGYIAGCDLRAEEYEAAGARLRRLDKLLRAGGVKTSEALLGAAAAIDAKLEAFYAMEGRAGEWAARAAALRGLICREALAVSQARHAAAERLTAAVQQCLADLAMPQTRFEVAIDWRPAPAGAAARRSLAVEAPPAWRPEGAGVYALGEAGLDAVEYRMAAGPAEPMRPLSAVASGGESARIMLALMAAPLFAMDSGGGGGGAPAAAAAAEAGASAPPSASAAPILVLDEIDSGIGSRLGASVGSLLRRMAGGPGGAGQILCITHLPQVACYAAHHVKVVKASVDGRAVSSFVGLRQDAERVEEVAAMGGLPREVAAQMFADGQTAAAR